MEVELTRRENICPLFENLVIKLSTTFEKIKVPDSGAITVFLGALALWAMLNVELGQCLMSSSGVITNKIYRRVKSGL